MIEIVPAIVPKNFGEIEARIKKISELAGIVQIDICDGKFAKDKTWPFENDNGEFAKITSEEKGLPGWSNMDFEVHLMTETPADEVADWARAGAMRILVPIEAGSDAVADILEEWGNVTEIGLVGNMETPVEAFEPYFDKIQTIQLMSIDEIGHQGEPFDDRVFDKIKKLRAVGFHREIAVDGGINLNNAKDLILSGANRLVIGSAIWESDNPLETIKKFQRIGGS